MNLWLKIIILNIFLFLTGFLIYEHQTDRFEIFDKKNNQDNSEVLAAVSTTEVFETVQTATIIQYPDITYSDSRSVSLRDKFLLIRPFSNPQRFTNHLCNRINTSNTPAGNAWKNDTLGCSGYTPDPKFVKLNFGSDNQRLVLYNNFSVFSINNSNKTVKFESLHIDRFLSGTTGVQNCAYKYDPNNIYPVKSSDFIYLTSKFKGINNNNCLQFYDHENSGRSLSNAPIQLILGYQFSSNGELNRNYNRNTYPLIDGIPFGPGPQNSTHHALVQPISELIGCSKYDQTLNCTNVLGLNILNKTYIPTGTKTKGECLNWSRCPNNRISYTCKPNWTCDSSIVYSPDHKCSDPRGVACGSGNPNPQFNCWPNWSPTNIGDCEPKSYYRCCLDYDEYYTGSKFTANLNTYSYSNFTNFVVTPQTINVVGPNTETPTTLPIPKEYEKYDDEISASTTDTTKAIKFTNDLNNSVFVTNKYLFKITQNNKTLVINRYSIDTAQNYTFGGNSYISQRPLTVTISLSSGTHINHSLDYLGDDIFVMASGSTTFDLFKILNLNSTSSTRTSISLKTELEGKLPAGFKNPRSMGVVPDGETGVMYLLVKDRVFYLKLKPESEVIIIDNPTYNNFLFNGNVFSKEILGDGFMFDNPTNNKLDGNFVTSKNISSNLKFFDSALTSFYYPNQYLPNILGFLKTNSFKKFNYLTNESITTPERVPLDSYDSFNPNSANNFEIVTISKGKGIIIELTNQNIQKNYDKYTFINLDKTNRSRVAFYVDCNLPSYSLICSGTRFHMKGAVLGHFYLYGSLNDQINTSRFISIHENPDILLNLFNEVRKSKIQTVSSTLIHLNYDL